MGADPISSLALLIVLLAVAGYALSWIIRRAVAAGIRDAASSASRTDGRAGQRVDR